MPASVRDVVRRRVERLPDDSRTVLSVAAVAGAAVGIDVLAEACGVSADAALDALEPPFLIGLVEEAGPAGDQVRFAHALVAETLATDLPAIRRRRLHGRIADAIETVHGADLDEHLASLAHHHGQAAAIGHAAAATRFAVLAARQAERRGAVFEAARLLGEAEAAAELDPASTPSERLDLTLEANLALGRSGDVATRTKVVEAMDRAEALGDAERMAHAARALMAHTTSWTWADMRTRHEDVIARLERALTLLGEQDSADRARLLGYLALGVYTEERRRCFDLAAEGVAIAARLGDDELRGECLNTQVVVLNDLDQRERPSPGGRRADRARSAARPAPPGAGRARLPHRRAHHRRRRPRAPQADVDTAEAVLGRQPDPPIRTQLAHYLPRRCLIEGRFADAEAGNARAYEIRRATSLWWGAEETFFSVLYDIRREQGRLIEMLPWFETDIGDDRVLIDNVHAQALVEEGRIDEARAVLGARGIRRPIDDWWWIAEAIAAVELACALDDRAMAAELHEQLLPFSGLLACNGSITTAPPVDLFIGRLEQHLGDRAAARASFRAAARHGGAHRRAVLRGPERPPARPAAPGGRRPRGRPPPRPGRRAGRAPSTSAASAASCRPPRRPSGARPSSSRRRSGCGAGRRATAVQSGSAAGRRTHPLHVLGRLAARGRRPASVSPAAPVRSMAFTSRWAASTGASSAARPVRTLTTPPGRSEVASTSPSVTAGSGRSADATTTHGVAAHDDRRHHRHQAEQRRRLRAPARPPRRSARASRS